MTIDDERIRHLRECFDRSIGPEATSTVMSMLTSVDVTNLATKDDIRQLMDRMDHRFEMVDLKFEALDDKLSERIQALDDKLSERIQALDERVNERIQALDERVNERIQALDEKFTERVQNLDDKFTERVQNLDEKFSERIQALDDKFTERFEGTVHRIEAMVFRSINRHLTFSVTAMAAVSGMFTWLAR
jgi:DNA anti-recombination protein RmuC